MITLQIIGADGQHLEGHNADGSYADHDLAFEIAAEVFLEDDVNEVRLIKQADRSQ
jgi:hypothetical protein